MNNHQFQNVAANRKGVPHREEIINNGTTIASITRQRDGSHHCYLPASQRGWIAPTRKAAQTSLLAAL